MRARPGRRPFTVRAQLALTYFALVVVTGGVLVGVTAVVLRFVPRGNLVTAEDRGFVPDRDDLLRAYVPRALVALAVVCVVGALLGWFVAGRAVRRLRRVTDAAAAVADGSLGHRVGLGGPDDEVRRLADTFDTMLGRLQQQVEDHRQFAANASHQLRTPHAATRSVLEVARADPGRVDVGPLLERLTHLNDRAVALTEALLVLARAEASPPDPRSVDLTLAVDEALDTVAATAGGEIEVDTRLDAAVVVGDPLLIGQLVANLVHNAFVHNVPRGGWVRIGTATSEAAVVLRVENSGAVVRPELLPTLTAPFERGDAGRRAGGTGLGLAVAAAVARAHLASLDLRARADGGLLVEVRFPRGGATPRT